MLPAVAAEARKQAVQADCMSAVPVAQVSDKRPAGFQGCQISCREVEVCRR